jgi:hypothetical protein
MLKYQETCLYSTDKPCTCVGLIFGYTCTRQRTHATSGSATAGSCEGCNRGGMFGWMSSSSWTQIWHDPAATPEGWAGCEVGLSPAAQAHTPPAANPAPSSELPAPPAAHRHPARHYPPSAVCVTSPLCCQHAASAHWWLAPAMRAPASSLPLGAAARRCRPNRRCWREVLWGSLLEQRRRCTRCG